MRYFTLLVLLASAFGADQKCLVLAPALPATGVAALNVSARSQRHAMVYLYGEYPEGVPYRNQVKDTDVDKFRAAGAKVIILDAHYTREDLEKAKQECAVLPH